MPSIFSFLKRKGKEKDKKKKGEEEGASDEGASPPTAASPLSLSGSGKPKAAAPITSSRAKPQKGYTTSSAAAATGGAAPPPSSSASAAASAAAAGKKRNSPSPTMQALPPPPPPPPANSPGLRPGAAPLELQRSAFDDTSMSTPRGVDLFPSEMSELTIPQLTEVYQVFRPFLDNCTSTAVKQASVSRLRKLLPDVAAAQTTVTAGTVASQGFHPSFGVEPLLNHLLSQPAPLRARLCLAIYRFCGEVSDELEDEALSQGTSLFAALQAMNPNLRPSTGGGDADGRLGSSSGGSFDSNGFAKLERCRGIDLPRVYHHLLNTPDYLPTAEELNEIFLRAQDVLRAEPNVLMVAMPAVLVGDLHGQIRDLLESVLPLGGPLVSSELLAAPASPKSAATKSKTPSSPKTGTGAAALAAAGKKGSGKATTATVGTSSGATPAAAPPVPSNYLFLGDYVDRGPSSLRVLAVLLTAKLLSPNTVYLLRGNHECCNTNRFYGFLDECHRRYPVVNNKVTTFRLCTLSPSEEDAEDAAAAASRSSSSSSPGASSTRKGDSDAAAASSGRSGSGSGAEPIAAECGYADATGDDMGWDMKDHPLWTVANDALRMLPLCAALYEEVEIDESVASPSAASAAADGDNNDSSGVPDTPLGAKKPLTKKPSRLASRSSSASTNAELGMSPKLTFGGKSSFSSPKSSKPDSRNGSFAKPRKTRQVVRVCGMHGGLSPFIDDSFDGIISINRFRAIERGALADLTWSDPSSAARMVGSRSASPTLANETDLAQNSGPAPSSQLPLSKFQMACHFTGTPVGFTGNPRGTGHIFGEDVTVDFINTNHLYFVVRAHQCVQEGYQWTHENRLLTVFSAPNYCGMRNKGAILLLDKKGTPTLKQYEYTETEDGVLAGTTTSPQPPKIFS